MTAEMPHFCVEDYDRLLERLMAAQYELWPVEELPRVDDRRVVLLRHDLDLHISGIEPIAEIESNRGVAATYYVPLTPHFNPLYPENRDLLRWLVASGHRVGLHYDLQTYPYDEKAAWEHLEYEVELLSSTVEAQVESICMHAPWGGREDIFRVNTRYVHPHDPRYTDGALYISDSCRAWRDEELPACFDYEPPQLVLLNTHPELWLGIADMGRYDFAGGVMLENVLRQHRAYVLDYMIPAWKAHPAPKLHDARERRRAQGVVTR
jgi:hypothetical protein